MRELRQQLVNALLAVLTVAALVAAVVNFEQQAKFRLPVDGATWVDHGDRPMALRVDPEGPAAKAGIRDGDQLVSIATVRVTSASQATQILGSLPVWNYADYHILQDGIDVPTRVMVGEAPRQGALYYQYAVGVIYLAIGLYVYVRRRGAPRALHFFLLCLVSFILSAFHYTGKLNNFDKGIYLGNVAAGFLAPALFLHFACSYPAQQRWIRRKGAAFLVYLPGLAMLALHLAFYSGWLRTGQRPMADVLWALDRTWLAYLCSFYLIGAGVFHAQRRHETDAVVRSQLTWLRNGALAGILPFALIYALPYALGVTPSNWMSLAVLSLPLIPLTWAYAIFRYRLMDVEIIFEQGAVYTLATVSVLGIFYGLIVAVSGAGEMNNMGMVAMILIAAFIFQPIRNWIRELLNRYVFYKDRYDYRRTLIEFARELGSPTDLHAMLESVADRLIRTLGVKHVAFFVRDDLGSDQGPSDDGRFRLELASNRAGDQTDEVPDLDLSFLSANPAKPYLFFERTRHMLDVVSHELPADARRSIGDLELTYYFRCMARGRTIAYLGASRTDSGDFLSSEDTQLVQTVSGYVGIAVDNAILYESLQRKVDEYERLKEYSENIVESIHVGILASDLDDRVESWNSQMERLTGIPRVEALGQLLGNLLPRDLCTALEPSRGESGIQNLYKYDLKSRQATLNIATAPLFSKDGARIGRLIIFDDVTDRAELERRLVQADKLSSIGLLAAGVAHEVNTPLAVISTYAQMLAKQISGDEQKAPLLEKIARQTFRASEIVNSLLNFSRVSPSEFTAVDLNKVVRETVSLVEHQFERTNVGVDVVLDETIGSIQGNAGKLQQVMLNLIMNARDAMPSGGTLSIHTSRQAGSGSGNEGAVRVTVMDTGTGIPADVLPRIFDPFFTTKNTVDPSFTAQGGRLGTGLGLSVSYGIVREHGGEIEVESAVGRGTRFLVTFPVAVTRPRTPSRGEPRDTPRENERIADEPVSPVAAIARTEVAPGLPAGVIARTGISAGSSSVTGPLPGSAPHSGRTIT